MIKLREGFHESKNGKTRKKTNETKSSFSEWVNKIEKPLHQIREKEAQLIRSRIKWGLSLLGIKKKKKNLKGIPWTTTVPTDYTTQEKGAFS